MATQKYPGDKVEALMMSVETEEYGYNPHRYKMNNHIFWALGQLGDKRALPFLRNLVTGEPCDHKTNLCQGEIKEAIQKLESNQFNLPKFLWRGILNYGGETAQNLQQGPQQAAEDPPLAQSNLSPFRQ